MDKFVKKRARPAADEEDTDEENKGTKKAKMLKAPLGVIRMSYGTITHRPKVAAFDLDDTLVKPKFKGNRFASKAEDWLWLNDNVKPKLKELSKDHTLVVFTNQSGIKYEHNETAASFKKFTKRMDLIAKDLDLPLLVYASTGMKPKDAHSRYKKPETGSWELYKKELGACPSLDQSYFVGDAADPVKNHSDSDKKFAENIGLEFKTPNMFFL